MMQPNRTFIARALAMVVPFFVISAPGVAHAVQYDTVLPEESEVTFRYQQMGVKMDGKFTAFEGSLAFDPDNPEAAEAQFEVDLSSVDTGTSDGNDEIVGAEWFHVDAHPVATFVSDSISVVGDGEYDVQGTLAIKGIEHKVTVPAVFHEADGKGIFEAEFTLQRGDYAIGEGSWSSFDIVANDVTVTVTVVAEAN